MSAISSHRLPSFNDFSPGILNNDLRIPLQIVKKHNGNRKLAQEEFAEVLFNGVKNKRSTTNVPATLFSTLLVDRDSFKLTNLGESVCKAKTSVLAAQLFVKNIYEKQNGDVLIQAVRNLSQRSYQGNWKAALKNHLELLGVTNLSNATTDHTTLVNWMITAGIINKSGRQYSVNEDELKQLVGISALEYEEIQSLSKGQKLFIQEFRRKILLGPTNSYSTSEIFSICLDQAPAFFQEDQLRETIIRPLENDGWLQSENLSGGRGAKSGIVIATQKLLNIPEDYFFKDYSQSIPSDLYKYLTMSIDEIKELLDHESKYERGVGLELLALNMILDLGLDPKGFRERSKVSTGSAEVDLIAEGKHLFFSRWIIQCKHFRQSGQKVRVADLAKEVGMATFLKAHVIMIATTTGFTADALDYAEGITKSTYLQFLLIDGNVTDKYITKGASALTEFAKMNATHVMKVKDN